MVLRNFIFILFFSYFFFKSDELQKSQILINELQRKLLDTNQNTGGFKSNTLNSIDLSPMCCTKCNEELEIKIRQIENLKM